LKLEAQGPVPAEGAFPECKRRPSGRCRHGIRERSVRSCRGSAVRSLVAAARPRIGKGNVPRRRNPKGARDTARGEIRRRCAPTGRGIKPLKRGRFGSNAYSAESAQHQRPERDAPSGSFEEHVVRRPIAGRCGRKQALTSVLLRSVANRRRGCPAERRRRSLFGQAPKGGAP
jgi:hypothetical protein